jgi:hypothetical protein
VRSDAGLPAEHEADDEGRSGEGGNRP